MQQGTIAGLTDKGFGFIKIEGAAKDLFFHSNELVDVQFDSLQVGDTVSFEIGEGPKGAHATNVRKI
ncbi:MAG TPA: cold shock domain-containing protein [Candidatus Paceibacterota bacterium]|nr:cold shock domain-containing protein [Candidatus Paceibacterota bacterium]